MAACGQPGRPPLEAATPRRCLPQIPLTAAPHPQSPERRAGVGGGGLARRPLPARSGVMGRRFGNGGLPTWTCSPEVSLSLSPVPLPPSFRPFPALGPVLMNPDRLSPLVSQTQAWSSQSLTPHLCPPPSPPPLAGCLLTPRALGIPRSQSSAHSRPSHPQELARTLVVCPPRP